MLTDRCLADRRSGHPASRDTSDGDYGTGRIPVLSTKTFLIQAKPSHSPLRASRRAAITADMASVRDPRKYLRPLRRDVLELPDRYTRSSTTTGMIRFVFEG